MRSDLPGQVTAQVTENVYDSPTGRYLLIPQGSKLIGTMTARSPSDRTACSWCGRG
jgi:type IV secretion system protein TrbI